MDSHIATGFLLRLGTAIVLSLRGGFNPFQFLPWFRRNGFRSANENILLLFGERNGSRGPGPTRLVLGF